MAVTLQPVSWERMENAAQKVQDRLHHAAQALSAAGIPYAVAGECAVALWVAGADESAVRNIRHVEFLLRRSDFDRIRSAFALIGLEHRLAASFDKPGVIDLFVRGSVVGNEDAVYALWASEPVVPNKVELCPDVDEAEVHGEFRVLPLPALIRMLLFVWGDLNKMHLHDLKDVGLVDELLLPALPTTLQYRLKHILATE